MLSALYFICRGLFYIILAEFYPFARSVQQTEAAGHNKRRTELWLVNKFGSCPNTRPSLGGKSQHQNNLPLVSRCFQVCLKDKLAQFICSYYQRCVWRFKEVAFLYRFDHMILDLFSFVLQRRRLETESFLVFNTCFLYFLHFTTHWLLGGQTRPVWYDIVSK